MVLIFALSGLKGKEIRAKFLFGWNVAPALAFVAIMAITTGIELIASYLLEWATGGWLWNYNDYAFQFQGRIALNPSIRFGIGGILILYVIQPLLELGIAKLGRWGMECFFFLGAAMIGTDFVIKMISLLS